MEELQVVFILIVLIGIVVYILPSKKQITDSAQAIVKTSNEVVDESLKGLKRYNTHLDKEIIEEDNKSKARTPMTKAEAVNKLKEYKELLDLQVVTQEEYDSLKDELSIIILGEKQTS